MSGGTFDFPVCPTLPAADLARAKEWYREKLGVTPAEELPEGLIYRTGGGRWDLYPSASADTNQATAATIIVDDVDRVVDELTARGVTFERYDVPGLQTDARGVGVFETAKMAWFKDSEGNILAVEQRI
ncbi:MAG TPA: VOC family protein [Actinomycetota bacterium]|nr:VOC family protein [Actinomycetota bacterium]